MVEKQKTGFRFGKYRLKVLEIIGELKNNGRTYRLVKVQTNDGLIYYSIRLYNARGKFIKQFLYEPNIARELARIMNLTVKEVIIDH